MAHFNKMLYISLLAILLAAVDARAQVGTEFEVDSIKYRIISKTPNYVGVSGCDENLTVANIPQTVKYLNTTYLVTEILSNSLRQYCLRKVYIPDSVTKIGTWAFGQPTWGYLTVRPPLEFVSIGASVEAIEDGAFDKCTDLAEFVVSPNNPKYDSRDNCKAIIETATNTLVKGGVDSNIPASVVAIGKRAFMTNKRLLSVHIPETIKEIGEEAFSRCANLKSVIIDGELSSIPYRAFSECYLLDTLCLPASLQTIESEAFWACNSMQEVVIPDNVTTIADKAFGGTYTDNNNHAPYPPNHYDTYIDNINPNQLSTVYIGAAVESFVGAFDYCTNLIEFAVSPNNTKFDSRDNCKAIIETETNTLIKGAGDSYIPESVVAIAANAFVRCHTLHSITIPEGVRTIGENAFYECLGLKQMQYNAIDCSFTPNMYYYQDAYSFQYDYETLYEGCGKRNWSPFTYLNCRHYYYQGLEAETYVYQVSVTLGPKVERFPGYLLNDQSHVTSISLPRPLKSIGDYAMANTSLTHLIIPQSVQTIGAHAFWNTSLASTALPDSLQVIGDYAFADTGLKRVSLPESVVSLGLGVFKDAPLTRLVSHRDFPPYCAVDMSHSVHALSGLDYAQCELQVPEGKKEIYQSSFPWNLFENITDIPDGPKSRDLNGDGVVDIADLNIAINLMLGKDAPNVTLDQADLNDDGVVDIADLNMFINAMLGKD